MGAGSRLQSDGVHAGDFDKAALQEVEHFQGALRQRFWPVGMGLGEALDARDELIDPGVVLHGAGAERVHAEVDGVIPRGEAGEVADDLDLGELGELGTARAPGISQQLGGIDCRHIERRQLVSLLAGRRLFEDQALVLRLVGADFAGSGAGCGLFRCCHLSPSLHLNRLGDLRLRQLRRVICH